MTKKIGSMGAQRKMTRYNLVADGFETRDGGDEDPTPESDDKTGWPKDVAGLQLFEVSPDCLKIVDLGGTIRSVNAAGGRLLELDDASSLVGKEWTSLWPAASHDKVAQAMALARDGLIGRFSERCPTSKGTMKWWDVVVGPIRDTAGEIVCLVAMSRDITLQKQFEQRLSNSEQRFRALADNIAQFAWMADNDGNIFWYNQRWFQYTGTTMDEVAGWGWQKVLHPDHLERVVARFKRCLESGEPWEDTFPIRGADGTVRWFLSRAMPIPNEHGRTVLWCGTNTDVTEQRSTADRLRQKARIIELSHEAILVWEFKTGNIVTWNRGCRELYGYGADEAMGRSAHQLLRRSADFADPSFEAVLRQDGGWSGEQLHVAKDGSEVWVESRQEIIEIAGRNVVLETNRDFTARRQFDQMTQLMMAELDHRVKNTLAIVQSIASQTALRAGDLQSFNRSFSARLQSLASAHSLLTASHWSGADLYELLQSQLVETIGDERAVVIRGPNVFLPPQITLQLGLILFELASNARKHGALSVSGGQIEVTWTVVDGTSAPQLQFTWREQGGPTVSTPARRGFGTTLIERAGNQPHFKAALAFEPAGLICRISADLTAIPAGTAAFFNPRHRSGEPNVSPSGGRRKPTVLIVEDEPLIAIETETILSEAGYAPLGPCATVKDALAAIDKERPDLAVIDGSLLGEPVDAVAQRLRSLGVPFLVLTGFTRESLPDVVETSGAPVLRKPVSSDDLVRTMAELSSRRLTGRGELRA